MFTPRVRGYPRAFAMLFEFEASSTIGASVAATASAVATSTAAVAVAGIAALRDIGASAFPDARPVDQRADEDRDREVSDEGATHAAAEDREERARGRPVAKVRPGEQDADERSQAQPCDEAVALVSLDDGEARLVLHDWVR